VVEHLPDKLTALSSNPSNAKKEKSKRKQSLYSSIKKNKILGNKVNKKTTKKFFENYKVSKNS
jgi:hypothetical protein